MDFDNDFDTTEEIYRRQARDLYTNDDIDIRPDAEVSVKGHGAWVQAWVWIENE
jgi:hypothetical protein